MLSAGDFSSKSLLTTHTFTSPSSPYFLSLLVPLKTSPNSPSLYPSLLSRAPSQPFRRTRLAQRTNGSRVSASKKPTKRGVSPLLEMEGLGSFNDELDNGFDDDEEEEEEEDEGESFYLPFDKMNEWFSNKPQGFGEGKVYDTAVEDQLLEEMRQSIEAQAANLSKLKNENSRSIESKRPEHKKKVDEFVPSGVAVRVTNLPKKKNVHRDLSFAFKGVPGLISINPAVSGNKKTRDPICKGFGFVYFRSEKDANRFVETFSRQSIAFGKIQKQIKCEMIDSPKSDSVHENSTDNTSPASEVEARVLEEDQSVDYSETDDSSLEEWEISVSAEFDDPDEYDEVYTSEWEDTNEDLDSITELELNSSGSYEQRMESESIGDSLSSEIERIRKPVKRLTVKDKAAKVPKIQTPGKGKEAAKDPKLDIKGSAKRLKVKEKALLTDVFSKYGKKSAVASKKER